jgi:hypothetical protein
MTGARHNEHATGIMAKITHNAPQSELGKHVYVRVTAADLPALRALVEFLEAGAS